MSARARALAGAVVLTASIALVMHLRSGGIGGVGGPSGDEARRDGGTSVVEPVPTAAMAEETLERFEHFRSGRTGDRLALGSAELSAVARYALPGIFPPGVVDPAIELEGERIRATAHVLPDVFPGLPRIDGVVELLPDTLLVELRGWLEPFDLDRLAFTVDRIVAGGVPLPRRIVPEMLAALGREDVDGLAANALVVPRPAGLVSVVVQRDSLVLTGRRNVLDTDRAVAEESG